MSKKRDPMLVHIQRAKKAGISRQEVEELVLGGTKRAAKEQGWRDSELALTLAEREGYIDKVYGPKEG